MTIVSKSFDLWDTEVPRGNFGDQEQSGGPVKERWEVSVEEGITYVERRDVRPELGEEQRYPKETYDMGS